MKLSRGYIIELYKCNIVSHKLVNELVRLFINKTHCFDIKIIRIVIQNVQLFLGNHKKKLTQFWKKILLLFFTVIAQSNTLNGLPFRISSRTFKQTLNTPPMGNPLVLLKAKKTKNNHLKTI